VAQSYLIYFTLFNHCISNIYKKSEKSNFMKSKTTKTKLFVLLLGLCSLHMQAQVTIGSELEPINGALLELKETAPDADNATATRGLLLPRVKLTDLSKLYPMFASGYDVAENARHTGLTVYNVNQCPAGKDGVYDGPGVYTWTGAKWEILYRPVILEAAPAQTSQPGNTWGASVVRHQAKPGIYEEFYSACFGAAGRWMTTNLTAWSYDSNVTGATLPGNPEASNSSREPRWCYPGPDGGDGTSNVSYTANPSLGLLYNWPAATAKQNPSIANQGQAAGAIPGADEVETMVPGGRYQGICPDGWHLPSDREWNVLEKEIYEHAYLYSSYTQTDVQTLFPNSGAWDDSWDTLPDYRPSGNPANGHGAAMNKACEDDNPGRSNSLFQGGFNALSAGYNNGTNNNFNVGAYFWSSSSYDSTYAWRRYVDSDEAAVYRLNINRFLFFSVRCKKD
jgi:uncharacterized protein (TIGR02145 family)